MGRAERSEVESLAKSSDVLGLKKKYRLGSKGGWADLKTKDRMALSGFRFLFDRSCFWTLAHQSLAR